MKVAAAVCTRDRPELLAACLPTILAEAEPDHEVVVIDQSDDDLSERAVARLRPRHPALRYRRAAARGLAAARNLALELTDADLLAFTDDDCLVQPGWLGGLAMEAGGEQVGAVCGRALPDPPDAPDPLSVQVSPRRRVYRGAGSPWEIGSGNNMAVRRSAVEAVGRFDERLGAGARFRSAEDVDLLYRLLRAGFEVVYAPGPTVLHRAWRGPHERERVAFDYGVGIGAFCAKHALPGDPRPLRSLAGWAARAVLDMAHGGLARDPSRARRAGLLLAGLARGAAEMALDGRHVPTTGTPCSR